MLIELDFPVSFSGKGGVPYVGISQIDLQQTIDVPSSRIVYADTNFGQMVLWEGDAYDDAGDYTQQQINDRIKFLFANSLSLS